jgi:translation initiation factor IF-3
MAIRVPQVRLINENDEMIGVVETDQARRMADDAGMDLVEVAADSDPPVCKIIDYGRYKYELSKKERANKAKTRGHEMKEVRLGRSMKIDPHDVEIRITQARKFLIDGHKVQIVQNFRGREMVHRERGTERMQEIIDALSSVSKVETPPRMFGRRMAKIEQYKHKMAREQAVGQAAAPPREVPAPAAPAASSD